MQWLPLAPGNADTSAPSSELEPELRKTSRASWSDTSIRSICSRTSTFTSMEEMLPMGAVHEQEAARQNMSYDHHVLRLINA